METSDPCSQRIPFLCDLTASYIVHSVYDGFWNGQHKCTPKRKHRRNDFSKWSETFRKYIIINSYFTVIWPYYLVWIVRPERVLPTDWWRPCTYIYEGRTVVKRVGSYYTEEKEYAFVQVACYSFLM